MILIMGYPNAGKTTYSKKYDNVIHLDDYPKSKFDNCNKFIQTIDEDVVVEGIYNLQTRREDLLNTVKNKDYKNICIWLDVPIEECIRRENTYRGRGEHLVKKNVRTFQPPTYDEGWDEIYIVRNGKKELLPKEDK